MIVKLKDPREKKSKARREHIPALDGLRGVAAICVVVSHCANYGLLPSFLGKGFGQQGVALFYTLSGYLIFRIYFMADFNSRNLWQYFVSRVSRVLPLYYFVLTLSFLAFIFLDVDFYDLSDRSGFVFAFLALKGESVLWSIPVELHFYLLFVVLWFAKSMLGSSFVICSSLFVSLLLALSLGSQGEHNLVSWMHFFILGGGFSLLERRVNLPFYSAFLILLFLPLALPEVRRVLGWPVLSNNIDPITSGYPILIFASVVVFGAFREFLGESLLRFFGEISFGVYLIHWPVLKSVHYLGGQGVSAFAAIFFITVALSAVSLVLFERPSQNIIRSILDLRRPSFHQK